MMDFGDVYDDDPLAGFLRGQSRKNLVCPYVSGMLVDDVVHLKYCDQYECRGKNCGYNNACILHQRELSGTIGRQARAIEYLNGENKQLRIEITRLKEEVAKFKAEIHRQGNFYNAELDRLETALAESDEKVI